MKILSNSLSTGLELTSIEVEPQSVMVDGALLSIVRWMEIVQQHPRGAVILNPQILISLVALQETVLLPVPL